MKLALPGPLHARPASLLVRLVTRHRARLELRKGGITADARKIMDLLALGAAKGDEVELCAEGDDAAALLEAVIALIERNFDADLVPEIGAAAVEGIALGRALVVGRESAVGTRKVRELDDELLRLEQAVVQAREDLDALVTALEPGEASLFDPERAILDDLASAVVAHVRAGLRVEDAVLAATSPATSDLLLDARARLLDALDERSLLALSHDGREGDARVLVTVALTPTLVARLPPSVCGIVAARPPGPADDAPLHDGDAPRAFASHAAILARARALPLALVPLPVAAAITDGELVLLDATVAPARVWVGPSEPLVEEAQRRRDALAEAAREAAREADAPIDVPVVILVNVGSPRERVPTGAQGIGLVRTELLFANRRQAPSAREQATALGVLVRGAGGKPVTVRLFDAGADKPLPWLAPSAQLDPEPARGIALLLDHPDLLESQLEAVRRVASEGDVRLLVPFTRSVSEIQAIRDRTKLPLGVMIESVDAVRATRDLAAAADFVCIGTNDLAASLAGDGRGAAVTRLEAALLHRIAHIVDGAHREGRKVTACGELAGDPAAARLLVGVGVDGLSMAPARIPGVRRALRGVDATSCRHEAERLLTPS